jgi:hypothetical protein
MHSEEGMKHLVKVRFDRRRADIDQAWLDRRYAFFAEHTLRSLRRNRCQDWTLWINCEAGMQHCVEKLLPRLPEGSAVTFGDGALQVEPCDCVYITRIDSDDLFAPDALQLVADCRPMLSGRVEASVFARGYIHELSTGRVGCYVNPSSPFHTLMIPYDQYRDCYAAIWHRIGDHSRVRAELPCQVLPAWRFCVLVHGSNFLSTFDYSRDRDAAVEKRWSLQRFADQPVTFDVDDFCDTYDCLAEMDTLRAAYPQFRATLFTVPARTSDQLLAFAAARPWLELGVHGSTHEPNEELRSLTPMQLHRALRAVGPQYAKVFRPPGWYIAPAHVSVLSSLGYAVALHTRDVPVLGPLCKHGFYACDDRPHWHGHTHNVCNNWLKAALPGLLKQWPREQTFCTVTESVLCLP